MVFLVVNMTNSLHDNIQKNQESAYNTDSVVRILEDASNNYKRPLFMSKVGTKTSINSDSKHNLPPSAVFKS